MTTKGGWCTGWGKPKCEQCRWELCQCPGCLVLKAERTVESGTLDPITKDGPGGALTPFVPGLDEQSSKGSARRMSQASVPVQTSRVEV